MADNPKSVSLKEAVRSIADPAKRSEVGRAIWRDTLTPLGNLKARDDFLERHRDDGFHCHIDLNNFKMVNDTYGHDAGDKAITSFGQIASKLSRSAGGKGFRSGGDEFIFHFNDLGKARDFTQALHHQVSKVDLGLPKYKLSFSAGVGKGHDHAEESLRAAKTKKVAAGAPVGQAQNHIHFHESLGKSEDLAKEMWDLSEGRQDEMRPFHGWLSPDGTFHSLDPRDAHFEAAQKAWDKKVPIADEASPRDLMQNAHDKGWISLGRGGTPTIGLHPNMLKDPYHPAMKALRDRIKMLPSDVQEVELHFGPENYDVVDRHLAEKGIFRKPSPVQQFHRSEDARSRLDDFLARAAPRGLISPKGTWHPVGAEEHTDALVRLSGRVGRSPDRSGHDGWIEVGKAGTSSVVADPGTLDDRTHPATKVLVDIIKQLHPSIGSVNIWHRSPDTQDWYSVPRHLAEKGIFRKPSQTAMFRSEDLGKEMWHETEAEKSILRPLHGWISPEGVFHQMKDDETHHEVAKRVHGSAGAGTDLHNAGWITTGQAGRSMVTGHPDVLANPSHPAIAKLRQIVRDLHPSVKEIEVHQSFTPETHFNAHPYKIPRHLAEKGIFREPTTAQQFHRSEEDFAASGEDTHKVLNRLRDNFDRIKQHLKQKKLNYENAPPEQKDRHRFGLEQALKSHAEVETAFRTGVAAVGKHVAHKKPGEEYQFKDQRDLETHLLTQPFALLSAHRTIRSPEENAQLHEALRDDLQKLGHPFTRLHGKWGTEEPSYMVHGIAPADAAALAKKYNQMAHISSDKGFHNEFAHESSYKPMPGHHGHLVDPYLDDNYSEVTFQDGGKTRFRVNLEPPKVAAPTAQMPHPHGYEWHNGHSSHYDTAITKKSEDLAAGRSIVVTIPKDKLQEVESEEADVAKRMAAGEKGIEYYWAMGRLPSVVPERIYFCWDGAVRAWHQVNSMRDGRIYMDPTIHSLKAPVTMSPFRGYRYMKKSEDLQKAEDQPATKSSETFNDVASLFGLINPIKKSNLSFYKLAPHEKAIDDLIKHHGYKVHLYDKPEEADPANKNYDTKHLAVQNPDPSGQGGVEVANARAYRKLHELAHALTLPEINKKYGEAKRVGLMGVDITPWEAKRSLEWEFNAAKQQRILAGQVGHSMTNEDFAKESNVTMADALHRVVYGHHVEPSGAGFIPKANRVSLPHALKTVDEIAQLQELGQDEYLPREEITEKSEEPQEEPTVKSEEPLGKMAMTFDYEDDPTKQYIHVWRMQDKYGRGPYQLGMARKWVSGGHMDDKEEHPTPSDDPGFSPGEKVAAVDNPKLRYGFATPGHLNDWFSSAEQAKLATLGFRPTKVKARRVWSGQKQVMFEPHVSDEEVIKSEGVASVMHPVIPKALTVQGKPLNPNVHLHGDTESKFDAKTGELHTPRGTFRVNLHDDPHKLDLMGNTSRDYFNHIITSPDVQKIHQKAMANWQHLNGLLEQRKTPEPLIAHAAAFTVLSANNAVPMQELMYSRLHDIMRHHGVDPSSLSFAQLMAPGGKVREEWKASDKPKELPEHAREYFEGPAKAGILQQAYSDTTGRRFGDILKMQYLNAASDKLAHYPKLHGYISDLLKRHGTDSRSFVSQMMSDKASGNLPEIIGAGFGPKIGRYFHSMLGGGNSVIPDTHLIRHLFGLDSQRDSEAHKYLKDVLWDPRNHHLLNGMDEFYHKNYPTVKFVQDKYFGGKDTDQANFPAFWLHWLSIAPHEKALGIGRPQAAHNASDHTPYWDTAREILHSHGLESIDKSESDEEIPIHFRTASAMHDLENRLGPAAASMIFYTHLLPHLLKEPVR